MISNVTADTIRSWPKNEQGWHIAPTGEWATIGEGATIEPKSVFSLSPLYILHADYLFYARSWTLIQAGCESHTFDDWADQYVSITQHHNITDQTKLTEYWSYIELINTWQQAYQPK